MFGQSGGSKADTLVKVVLVFFISLLSFSVGTFVGKQVSDSDHRRLALEGEYKTETAAHQSESEDKITDKEVASLTEEFVNKEGAREPAAASDAAEGHEAAAAAPEHGSEAEAAAPTTPSAAHDEPATEYKSYSRKSVTTESKPVAAAAPKHESKAEAKVANSKKEDMTHAIAAKVADGQAPSDGEKEERKPAAVLPSVASSAIGKYTVQVASYADEKEAKTHAANLKEKGYTAFFLPAKVDGKTWYRVLVGLFDSVKTAQDYRAQFLKEVNIKGTLVQKIVQ